jgi:hypothetical protein
LSTLTIPNSVKSHGDDCFKNCGNLKKLKLPKSVVSIGKRCFQNLSSLSSLIIPNSVAEIGVGCFQNCLSLQNFTISLKNLPTIKDRWWDEVHPFYSEAGSYLFNECPFHSSQLTPQV